MDRSHSRGAAANDAHAESLPSTQFDDCVDVFFPGVCTCEKPGYPETTLFVARYDRESAHADEHAVEDLAAEHIVRHRH